MARDFCTGNLIQVNIHSAGHIHDFVVAHHFYGRYSTPDYNQTILQDTENCHDPIGFVNVIKFTKNIGRKCLVLVYGAFNWLKVAIKKHKFKQEIEKNGDTIKLQIIHDDIQEIKQMVKELQIHTCPAISQETLQNICTGVPPPPPPLPPPLPVQNVSMVLPRPQSRRGTAQIASVAPTKPTISLEDLLKVKLKKPSERKFQTRDRKSAGTISETIQRVNLRTSRTPKRELDNLPETELSNSPVSSLKRLLSNNIDANRTKRRRKQFLQSEIS